MMFVKMKCGTDICEFERYKVRLNNGSGKAEIVDFDKFKKERQ